MLKRNLLSTNSSPIQASLDDFVIPATIVDFPRMSKVPSGYYFSEIVDVQPRISNTGKKCLDVLYEIWGFRDEQGHHTIRLSYPEGSQHLQNLYQAMSNAGIPAGSTMKAAIGVTEQIRLVYDDEDGIGRIQKRVYDPPEDTTEGESCGEEAEG